ncbi:MAG TPA: hypothetical protein VN493_31265 [Thermoanaerobaculia bacterium]|nr:hypothetical protein [Thermoanaerobaculia bacterium]
MQVSPSPGEGVGEADRIRWIEERLVYFEPSPPAPGWGVSA